MEHNRTYLQGIPDDLVKQARDYANYHDANAYSDPNPSGIGNGKFVVVYYNLLISHCVSLLVRFLGISSGRSSDAPVALLCPGSHCKWE